MSQRIVVFCDVHQARDEDVSGKSYDLALRSAGGSFAFATVDLCEVCAKPLLDVFTELVEVGREFEDAIPRPLKPKNRRGGRQSIPHTVDNRTCDVCGFISASREGMLSHERANHPRMDNPYPCEFCEFSSKAGQGLAAHVRSRHPSEWAKSRGNRDGVSP